MIVDDRTVVYDIHDLVKIYPGAGKSTLVRQMANLLRPTSGAITFLGQPLGSDPLHVPLHAGYMPQDAAAINNLTVGEALYFSAHLRGLGRAAAQQESQRLLKLWQIESLRDKVGPRLSGGERRLMQLAVAMAGAPPVLILDEPTNDLDPQRRKQVWEILRRLNQEDGATIIFITHDAIEAEKIIQRVGILRQGALVALGRPSQLKAQVDRKLRLEVFTPADRPPTLPDGLQPLRLDAGRWLVYLEKEQVGGLLERLDLGQVDDFRLYSATLEDLYLYYANHAEGAIFPDPTA